MIISYRDNKTKLQSSKRSRQRLVCLSCVWDTIRRMSVTSWNINAMVNQISKTNMNEVKTFLNHLCLHKVFYIIVMRDNVFRG